MIEFFAVPPEDDAAFLAVWAAEAPRGATLHRALRGDVQPRFASLPSGPADGVLLIVAFDVPAGEEDRLLAAWERAREVFSARQGFVGAWWPAEHVAVVHWSSPLMYARAVAQEGDVIAAIGLPSRAALYAISSSATQRATPSG